MNADDLDALYLVATHRRLRPTRRIHLIAVDDPSKLGVVDITDGHGVGPVPAFVEKPARRAPSQQSDQCGHRRILAVDVLDAACVKSSIERRRFRQSRIGGGRRAATDDYWIDAGRPGSWAANPTCSARGLPFRRVRAD